MFGHDQANIGAKMILISKNMFLNDFLYDILGETSTNNKKKVLKEYFRLNDDSVISQTMNQDTNLIAIIEADKLDLNNLFLTNMEK